MKFFRLKQRGQAVVEYALLLMIAALSATAFLSLDDSLKLRVAEIANEFQSDVAMVDQPPIEIEEDCNENKGINCLELSPPVAKFHTPSPNYKGRDIRLINESYDVDGFVEHYIWSVNGKIIKKDAAQINEDGGLVVNFRDPGNYVVSLIVIDNDGLVSSLYTSTVKVENRAPTLDVSVKNQKGEVGNTVSVYQGCQATFYTVYTDEDLPFDVLTLHSEFKDQSGVISTDSTVPHEFKRDFKNLGTNTYKVTVTDENGASVSETVTVNVIANPYGAGNCGPLNSVTKPKFKFNVYVDQTQISPQTGTNIYLIPAGKYATVIPVVTWGSFEPHSIPYYWRYTGYSGSWLTVTERNFPYPAPPNVFKLGDKDIAIDGMARDRNATSNSPDPALDGMSNMDKIILRTGKSGGTIEKPVAKITFNATTKVFAGKTSNTSTTPTEADLTTVNANQVVMEVESVNSTAPRGQTIAGVRWVLPDGTTRPKVGENGAVILEDVNGVEGVWYQGELNSPDTIQNNRTFTFVAGKNNSYNYKLEVITNQGVRSDVVSKTLKLDVQANKAPTAVCSPNTSATIGAGQNIGGLFNASKSSDPDDPASTLKAKWAQSPAGLSSATPLSLTTSVPNWKYSSAGTYKVYLQVIDPKGASDTAECTVTVAADDKYEFFVQFWYFNDGGSKSRVARASNNITLSNRTTDYFPATKTTGDIKHVYETIFTGTADTGVWTGAVSNKSLTGVDTRSGGGTDHHDDLTLATSGKQATFLVTLFVTDKDGSVSKCYNWGSSPTDELNNGKTYCKKPTRYFRTAEENRRQAGANCKYYTIHPNYQTTSQYKNSWNQSVMDEFNGVSVEDMLAKELKCQ